MPLKNLLRVALITLCILIIPFVLQLTIGTGIDGQGWNWKPGDFVIVGLLIFVFGSLIEFARLRFGRNRIWAIALIILVFLWLYAELAVGVFTNLGS